MGASMRRTIAIIGLLLVLSGCASPADSGGTVIGLTKADLLSCAGVPVHIVGAGNEERLVYRRAPEQWQTTTGGFAIGGGSSDGVGFGFGLSVPLGTTGRGCETTAYVVDGRVAALTLTPGSDPAVCRPLFASCHAR